MPGQEDSWDITWTGAVSFTPQLDYLLAKRPWLVGCQGQCRCCGEGRIFNARFDVLTSVLLQIACLCDVMLCCWVSSTTPSSGPKQYKTSALKLKALCSFETSGITCPTQHHIPEDWYLKMFQVLQHPWRIASVV